MLLFSDSSSPWVHRRHCSGHSQEMSTRLSESIGENLVTEFAWPNVTGRLLEKGQYDWSQTVSKTSRSCN